MGHITRTQTIARHLLAADPGCIAYLATESPIIGEYVFPQRCDYIKLPKRLVPEGIHETEEEESASKDHFKDIRSAILREATLALAPDLVLVDHEPLGYRGEFREALYALKARRPETKMILGLRDIMDSTARIRALWQELGVYDALENLFDGIAVYGQRGVYDVADAYAIPSSVHAKLRYIGYIVREPAAGDPSVTRRDLGIPQDAPLLVGTVGSGVDGFPVLDAFERAVARIQTKRPGLHAVAVTGPFMPPEQQAILRERATDRLRVVSRADNIRLMACADAVVSMGGYNSVFEALELGKPLVIVPRSTHKIEQQIRAQALERLGLARCVLPQALAVETLAAALGWALDCDALEQARCVRDVIPSFDGVTQLTSYLLHWLGTGKQAPMSQPLEASFVGGTA